MGIRSCWRVFWLSYVVVFARLIIATFPGALALLPLTRRSANRFHCSTGHVGPAANHDHGSSTFVIMDSATEVTSSGHESHFLALAEELVLSITSHLSRKEICSLALVSKKCHRLATPFIWKHVELIDCRASTDFVTGHRVVTYGPATATHRGRNIPAGTQLGSDEHDDTPLIKILLVLAT